MFRYQNLRIGSNEIKYGGWCWCCCNGGGVKVKDFYEWCGNIKDEVKDKNEMMYIMFVFLIFSLYSSFFRNILISTK